MCYNDSDNLQETELSPAQLKTLTQALELACRDHVEHSRTLDQCASTGGNVLITVDAATVLADTHRTMAGEANSLLDLLKRSSAVWVQTEE